MTLRYGSVCSGIEAASVAWTPLGFVPAWFSEIEPFPCSVLQHHYPHVPNVGDMTTITERILSGELEAPEILCGGTPCQAFSVAGNRASLDDDRGNLSLVFCEIANAIDHVRKQRGEAPTIIFWENVPGCLNTKDNFFGCFLAELAGETLPLEPPGGKWTDAGFVSGPTRTIAWRCLNAEHFGVAQRRRRIFVCATESGVGALDPRAVLFELSGLRRDIGTRPPTREKSSSASSGGSRGGSVEGEVVGAIDCRIPAQRAQNAQAGHYLPVPEPCFWDGSQVAGTLTKQGASGSQRMPDKGNFGAVLAPAPVLFCHDCGEYDITNGVCDWCNRSDCVSEEHPNKEPPVQAYSIREDAKAGNFSATPLDVSLCLNGLQPSPQSHHAQTFIAYNIIADATPKITEEVAGTLRADGGGGIVPSSVAYTPEQPVPMINMQGSKGSAVAQEDGPSYTLNAMHGHDVHAVGVPVAHPINTMTLGGRPDPVNDAKMTMGVGADGDPQYTISAAHAHAVAHSTDPYRCVSCGEVFQVLEGAKPECWCGETQNFERVLAHMFKIRGGSPVDTGEQGGKPGKAAGKGYLGQDEKAFTVASTQDQFLMQPTSVAFAQNTRDEVRYVGGDGEISGALAAQPGMKQQTYVAVTPPNPVAYKFDSLGSNSMKSSNPISGCNEVDISCTIDTTDPNPSKNQGGMAIVQPGDALAIATKQMAQNIEANVANTLGANDYKEPQAVMPKYGVGMLVRRLTPIECARLQGFPDDYLGQVIHRGKLPADGPIYKALGNSWAVPVVRWLGSRILREYQQALASSTEGDEL